jgi:hypothetical protein
MAKNTSVLWKGIRLNIVDTPGFTFTFPYVYILHNNVINRSCRFWWGG